MALTSMLSQFGIYFPFQQSTYKWLAKLIIAAGGRMAASYIEPTLNVIIFVLPALDTSPGTCARILADYKAAMRLHRDKPGVHFLGVEWLYFVVSQQIQNRSRLDMKPFTMDDTGIQAFFQRLLSAPARNEIGEHPNKKRRLPLDTPEGSRAATKIVTRGHPPTAAAPNPLSRSAGDRKTTRTAPHKRPNIPQALAIVRNTWSSKEEQHQKRQDGGLRQSLAAKAHLGELPKLPKLPPRHRNLFVTASDGTFARVVPSSSAPPSGSQTDKNTGPSHGRPPTMSSSSSTCSTATTTMAATVTPNGSASQASRIGLLGNWQPKAKAEKPIALKQWLLSQQKPNRTF